MSDETSAEETGSENSHDEALQETATSGRSGGGDHPSQAEGEDPDDPSVRPDPDTDGHPSQAEGEESGTAAQ